MPTPWEAIRTMLLRRRAESLEGAGRWQAAHDAFAEAAAFWEATDPILAGSLWSRAGQQLSRLEQRPAQLEASRRALGLLPPGPRRETPLAREDGLLAMALRAEALYWLDPLRAGEGAPPAR